MVYSESDARGLSLLFFGSPPVTVTTAGRVPARPSTCLIPFLSLGWGLLAIGVEDILSTGLRVLPRYGQTVNLTKVYR